MAGANVSMSASSISDPTMLCGYPHFLAVASLLIFWRCPRPCLLASRLALPTFVLPLAMRLSDRQNGRSKLLIRSRAWGSWQSLAHRARRGLELVQLPSCGDDRQSLLAMCVDVESFRYEAQSAAASAVGSGACAPTCAPRGWQCLAAGPSSLHPSRNCLPQPRRSPILSSPSRP